ncbi:MAG: hypothetical protein CAF43_012185 [Nitrospira sp. CG24C]|mgnify:CR=1 FL=1|jgi:hypothetical protein|nr:MAG: hypothetical protein CAF43_012185 [Nitrospira sp. CG24C]
MLKKLAGVLSVAMLTMAMFVSESMAQIFPVDAATTTTITSVKADIVAWGIVFIGVALSVFAYKRIKALVR